MALPALTNVHSETISIALVLVFTLIVKNVFWIYRCDKLVIQNLEFSEDQLEPLTDDSEDDNDHHHHHNQPHLHRSFSDHLIKLEPEAFSDVECPICLGPLKVEQGSVSSLRECGHKFHHECITHWLQMKNSCPLDRKPLSQ